MTNFISLVDEIVGRPTVAPATVQQRWERLMRTTGINHLALVCRDMQETVRFYTEVLDMPLVKTVALPDGGQHFFFDCGGGSAVAFFWWPETPAAAPGIASVKSFPSDSKT